MRSSDLGNMTCTTARTVDVVGDRWVLMILKELFMGGRRFEHFQAFTGVSPHLLSVRIRKMQKDGIIARRAYQQRPVRYEYYLTEKGIDLFPIIIAFKNWSERWVDWPNGPPAEFTHKHCNHVTSPAMVCSHCAVPVTARDIEYTLSHDMSAERQVMFDSFESKKVRSRTGNP